MLQNITSHSSVRVKTISFHLRRKTDTDNRLLNKEKQVSQNSGRFRHWTACFAFVTKFKKPKTKQALSEQSSAVTISPSNRSDGVPPTPALQSSLEHVPMPTLEGDQSSVASTVNPWKTHPATPTFALSPPPRSKKERACSLTPLPREPPFIPQRPLEKALRLSLDVDQQFSSISHSPSFVSAESGVMTQKDENECDGDTTNGVCAASTLVLTHQAKADSLVTSSQKQSSSHHVQNDFALPLVVMDLPPDSSHTPLPPPPSSPTMNNQAPYSCLTHPVDSPRMADHTSIEVHAQSTKILKPQGVVKDNDDNSNDEDDDEDYNDLLDRFQLPSDDLPIHKGYSPAAGLLAEKSKKWNEEDPRRYSIALARQQTMQMLVGDLGQDFNCGSKSMDIIRDKAYYDAVVSGTLQRRPWVLDKEMPHPRGNLPSEYSSPSKKKGTPTRTTKRTASAVVNTIHNL